MNILIMPQVDNINDLNTGANKHLMVHITENQWVAVVYDNNWYIYKIMEVDRHDNDVHRTFLERMNTKGDESDKI